MITLTMQVTKRCPFKDELDAGELVITLPGDAPELHALAKEIHGELCAAPVTHEDFTRAAFDLIGRDGLVVTRWHTGPWSVEVREGDDDLLREPVELASA